MSFFSIENLGVETTELLDADGIIEEVEQVLDGAGFYNIEVIDVWEDPSIGGWRLNVDVDHDDYGHWDGDDVEETVRRVIGESDVFAAHLDATNIIAGD